MIISNIVEKQKFREVQSETLDLIMRSLLNSFGPNASNTTIAKDTALTQCSKDGHTILKSLIFNNVIEQSVKENLEELTRHIVKTVGDGTTSAVILSKLIFDELVKLEQGDYTPYEIINEFKAAVGDLKEIIKNNGREFTAEDAYDISLISTNDNSILAGQIYDIYKKFGKDVFIDVSASTNENTYIKEYDGMTLNTGYSDVAFINNAAKGTSSLRNPKIYVFEDPVDTLEMFSFFAQIVETNIVNPYRNNDVENITPTVILAQAISRDLSSFMEELVGFMYSIKDERRRPPILIITGVYQKDELSDIARLCGCKPIRKYINEKNQQLDIEKGLAPTLETVVDFFGQAELVEADVVKTKFINPKLMYDENGNYSKTFNEIVTFLEAELRKSYEENLDINVIGTLKRRINSLKANMVELIIGGVSVTDRDNLRDLVEDAVLNCRSAARNGVGRGANFEGFIASLRFNKEDGSAYKIINDAYIKLLKCLYSTCYKKEDEIEKLVEESIKEGNPFNLKTKQFDGKVLSSIDSDIVILDTISKIVTLMFTSNQFICPTPVHNVYGIKK